MRITVLAIVLALALPGLAHAEPTDQERARAAMEAGEIMPLKDILAKIDRQYSGRVLDAKLTDLEQGLHGWIYSIKFLTPQDNLLVLKVDAGTGVILEIEGHGIEEARKPQ